MNEASLLANVTPLILAGGLGTRLRSELPDLPKALAPLGGRPFLEHLLDRMARAGFQRAVLCVGYRADMIQEAIGNDHQGLEVLYSRENVPLGTGGALRHALSLAPTPWLLACNGDSTADVALDGFVRWHFQTPRRASLVAARVEDAARYGRLSLDPAGRIRRFEEKGSTPGPGWINAGIYLLPWDLIADISPERFLQLEQDVFPGLANEAFFAFPAEGGFIDIGTPESYAMAKEWFRLATPPSKTITPP